MSSIFLSQTTFPSFRACPDENSIDLACYQSENGFSFHPHKHWCLLAEIVYVEYFIRLRLIVRDRSGEKLPVAFHLDNEDELDLSDFQIGSVVAILYAHQHGFLDMTVGVRQETERSVMVSRWRWIAQRVTSWQCETIPLSLEKTLELGNTVHTQMMVSKDKIVCQVCKSKEGNLKQCGRCRVYWYCSKVCTSMRKEN